MDSKCINSIRVLAADTVQKANSGHPGAPMGCAPMAHVLWTHVMNYNPENPHWAGRDRFVLSNGHACALQYCMLHLTGYKVSMDDLKQFRQVGSITPGHPERGVTDGVEVSTGPLGQGICNGVGLALAEAQLSAHYNKEGHNIIDNYTYVICGDGCLQEGVSGEASSLAGHLGLGKLIVLYDDNRITIDGETNLSFSEDVLKRYEAYGWHTSAVADGNVDTAALKAAIEEAKSVTDRPSIIKVRTTIGLGSAKEGTEGVHGAPLGVEDLANVKTKFGLDPSKSFEVEGDVLEVFRSAGAAGASKEAEWNAKFEKYAAEFPKEAAELSRRLRGGLPEGWKDALPTYPADYKADASRNTSGQVLNAVAEVLPELIGGSADLTPSNKTALKCTGDFQRGAYDNRYLRFGVREHAMCSISNGIHAYGAHLPFAATFLVFTGYAMGAVRLSALSHHQILYIMTHDGIGVGEDGPTHQQIEILSSLRSTPNISVWRPADGNEVAAAYEYAIERRNGPTFLALSRQNINAVPGSSRDNALRGAYVVTDEATDKPAVQIVATGSEMDIAMDAMRALKEEGVYARVISMPCFELFEEQSNEYKASVFLADVPTVSVEAASVFGWAKYSHVQVGMRSFGESGPYKKVYEKFNITAEHTATVAKRAIAFYASRPVPNLLDTPDFA